VCVVWQHGGGAGRGVAAGPAAGGAKALLRSTCSESDSAAASPLHAPSLSGTSCERAAAAASSSSAGGGGAAGAAAAAGVASAVRADASLSAVDSQLSASARAAAKSAAAKSDPDGASSPPPPPSAASASCAFLIIARSSNSSYPTYASVDPEAYPDPPTGRPEIRHHCPLPPASLAARAAVVACVGRLEGLVHEGLPVGPVLALEQLRQVHLH